MYVANRHYLPFIKHEEKGLSEKELKHLILDSPWL